MNYRIWMLPINDKNIFTIIQNNFFVKLTKNQKKKNLVITKKEIRT